MKDNDIHEAVAILQDAVRQWRTPAVTIVSQREGDPFKVLISCILSLRTQDKTTGAASARLFALAGTPAQMVLLSRDVIEKTIYPVGILPEQGGADPGDLPGSAGKARRTGAG